MKKPIYILGVLLIAVSSLIFASCSFGNEDTSSQSADNSVKAEEKAPAAPPSDARNTPVVQAAKKVGPAIVGITNKAVARDQLALLSRHAAERNAVGEGDADHEAALVEIALVEVGVNAEVDLDFACVRADGPDEFVTEIIGDAVGQERSDDVDDVIIARGNVYVQIRLDRDAVGEDTDDALGKSRAV